MKVGEYRRGRVAEVFESDDGLVRNVLVQRYRHDRRRQVDIYSGEGQVLTKMAIQSLVLLLPVEEQGAAMEDTVTESDAQVTRDEARVTVDPIYPLNVSAAANTTQRGQGEADQANTEAFGIADIVEIDC